VLGPKSGMAVTEPTTVETEDDSVRAFLEGTRNAVQQKKGIQIVVAVVPNDNKTRYDAIKKYCCLETSVPSQVIKARSLEKNTLSVCSKILLQMNCKLGGSLWRVAIPMKNAMIIGYDMYNDSSSRNKKVGAAVFSLNDQFTKWYSQCEFHGQPSELVANLSGFCTNGLKKYQEVNGRLPDRIILFRDGVGDGHIPVVFKDELPQIQKAFSTVGGSEYKPRFAFVIVTKRVHTRYFKMDGNNIVNPIPGTVVDDVITRPERYDFYLVPQCVRQGTVTPVSYNVIFDESGLSPTNMQRLAYKLCHMYFNWQGTIRVPAPCQFAHKLAFLVGQTLHQPVDESLADKLFFL